MEESPVIVVGAVASDSKEYRLITEASRKLYETIKFGIELTGNSQKLTLFRNFNQHEFVEGDWEKIDSLESITEWIQKERFPDVEWINKRTGPLYVDIGTPIAFIFVDQDSSEHMKSIGKTLAPETKLKLNFVLMDWERYGAQAPSLGLSGEKVPALAIEDTHTQTHWVFPEDQELTLQSVKEFVDAFFRNEVKPTLRGENVPVSQTGPVTVVVSSTFEELVLRHDKDVVIDLYAPWCGHCKALEPTWNILGEYLANIPDLVVAKMNAESNEMDPKYGLVSSYPSVWLFRQGQTSPVKMVTKDRSLDGLLGFIKESASPHVSKQITVPAKVRNEEKTPDIFHHDQREEL